MIERTMNNLKKISLSKLLIITMVAFEFSSAYAQNVAQWRGINRDGQYKGTNLLNAWPEGGPELLWFTEEIGNGYGSPSITNDRVFVNGERDSVSYLFAFDLKGTLLWKSPNGNEFTGSGFSHGFPGARSTPTIMGNLAYACSGNGRIACYETSNGAEKWAIDMVKELGGCQNEFGYSESLLVDDKTVFCFPGGSTTNVAAFNRFTGKPVWTSKALGDTTAFCSPIFINLPGRKILVTSSRHFLFAVDCSTGELLWSYPYKGVKNDGQHCNTPIYAGGFVYFVAGEEKGNGTVKLELAPDGKSVKEVWINKLVRNALGGFVIVGSNLFTTIDKNYLKSVKLSDGMVVDSVKMRHGSLIYADTKFICYGNTGEVSLINYDQKKFNVTGKLKIDKGSKEHFAHPVLANGILYVRHGKALMAYKVN